MIPATSIDLRVGGLMDGAVVYYQDDRKVPCGPRWGRGGNGHHFGKEQSLPVVQLIATLVTDGDRQAATFPNDFSSPQTSTSAESS